MQTVTCTVTMKKHTDIRRDKHHKLIFCSPDACFSISSLHLHILFNFVSHFLTASSHHLCFTQKLRVALFLPSLSKPLLYQSFSLSSPGQSNSLRVLQTRKALRECRPPSRQYSVTNPIKIPDGVNHLFLVFIPMLSENFIHRTFILFKDRQTDKHRQKHNLLGGGNNQVI